jgi:hypothetical protein
MDQETRKWMLIVVLLLVGVGVAASGAILVACAGADKPNVSITAPATGSQFNEGAEIIVQATATDPKGIARVEFAVDGVIVGEQKFPNPQNAAAVIYTWKSIPAGAHTFSMRAFNQDNAASNPALISVNVIAQANATPTTIALATPTATSAPAPAPCINNAAFVADISIPDGTMMAANQTFNKIWRVTNTGTCPWDPSYQFVFVGGEAMTNLGYIGAPYTAPGATTDLVIALTAPATPGPHAGRWHLKANDGTFFGPMLDVRINVPNPAPPPVCSGNPNIASFSASANAVAPHSAVTLNWGLVGNANAARIDPGIGDITTPGSFVVVVDARTTFVLTARCDANIATAQVTVNVVAPPSPTATPIPPTSVPAFRVTGATASVNPSNYTATCPGIFNYVGNITTNQAGVVTYRWAGSSSTAPSPVMTFNAPGAGSFALPGYQAQWGAKGGQWAQLMILTPNQLTSNQASFTNSCADPKPAPPVAEILEPQNGFVGSTLAPVHIVFRGRDANDMKSITLFGNGAQLAKQASPNRESEILGQYDWHAAPGRVEIYAIAEDWDGQTTRSATLVGEIKPPAPAPTVIPPTRVPPTAVPPTPVPQRRNVTGTWVAGEYELELSEPLGCTTECAITGRLIKARMPAPEIHDVRGTLNPTTGAITWSITLLGGQSFNGTVSADSRTMSGTFGGAALTFTKK